MRRSPAKKPPFCPEPARAETATETIQPKMGATVFVHLYYSKAREDCQCKTAFFFFFLLESFCFNVFFRGTAQRAVPAKAFCAGCFVRLFHVEQFECSILKVAPKKRRTISLAALCKTECSMWNNATESLGCCPIKAAASAGDALQKSCKNRCFYSPSKKPAGIPAFLTRSRSVWPFGFVETSVDVAANDS